MRARLLLEGLHGVPDIICLQEHKLRAGRTDHIPKEVWRPAYWITAPAADGVHAQRNGRVEAGRGGVALGFTQDLRTFITKEGTLPSGRAVWACLTHPAWGKLGIVGIYGPNEGEGRLALWSDLTQTLDPAYHWIVMGDFNMTTLARDQLGGDGVNIGGREARMWARLIRKLNIQDTFHHDRNTLRFSWDNRQLHRHNPANLDFSRFGTRKLRRIDRIYAQAKSRSFPFHVTSKILLGFAFSDHAPVVAWIKMGDSGRRPSSHRMNAAHLCSQEYRDRIEALWAERKVTAAARGWTDEQLFLSCMRGTRAVDRCWGKRRASERKARLMALQTRLAGA